MLIKSFVLGLASTNCYIVTDESTLECVVIDPGASSNTIMNYLEQNRLTCKYVLLTHGHFDHTGAVDEVCDQTGAPLCMNEKDKRKNFAQVGFKFEPPKNTTFIKEGDTIEVGTLRFEVIETPGHSEGSVCFICGEAIFTGDTLFRDSMGRTDFPGCSASDMMKSLRRLYELDGDYEIYPGHMEPTTLSRERQHNYFMREAIGG